MDWLPQGLLLLDAKAEVLFANESAKDLLAAGDALALEEGRLVARREEETLSLLKTIAATLAMQPKSGGYGYDVLPISRGDGRRDLLLTVAPLACDPADAETAESAVRPQAVVFVDDPESPIDLAPDKLMRLHALSRAEAGLVLALLDARSLDEAAAHLGIGVSTARTHMKRIFQKTGTHRQAEVIRLILKGPRIRSRQRPVGRLLRGR